MPPTWLALWNCFFSPATDIAAAPGRGWVVSGARPGHAAATRWWSGRRGRSPRAGLRQARLPRPRPRPRPLSHSHTRAHTAGNTAFPSPRAAHWSSRGGMQIRPLGPPTLHCCVGTQSTPAAGELGVGRSWRAGDRAATPGFWLRARRDAPGFPRASGWGWGERDPLAKLLLPVRHLLSLAGNIAPFWRIWVGLCFRKDASKCTFNWERNATGQETRGGRTRPLRGGTVPSWPHVVLCLQSVQMMWGLQKSELLESSAITWCSPPERAQLTVNCIRSNCLQGAMHTALWNS